MTFPYELVLNQLVLVVVHNGLKVQYSLMYGFTYYFTEFKASDFMKGPLRMMMFLNFR